MPAFSTPNSSHVTGDIENYYAARQKDQSRNQAARGLSLEISSYRTLQNLDMRIITRATMLKACEPDNSLEKLFGYPFLLALAVNLFPITTLNRKYLHEHGRAWLFGNLAWLCRKPSSAIEKSLNISNALNQKSAIDSS